MQQKNEAAVSAIVRAGSADPNIPVMVVCTEPASANFSRLIKFLVCVCIKTQTTPLMLAARLNNRVFVDMLLEDSVILVKVNQQNNVRLMNHRCVSCINA